MRPSAGVVSAPQPLAAEAGADVLRAGGNAVDGAIAAAFVQGVVDPLMGGIGGFGCMVVRVGTTGNQEAISFHGRAGTRATPDVFARDVLGQVRGHAERYDVRGAVNQIGYQSVVVPGMVAGLSAAHKRFCRLPWHILLEPAISLAKSGFPLPGEVYDQLMAPTEAGHKSGWDRIHATDACAAIFTNGEGLLSPGDTLRQPDYAATLERLAAAGAQDFYSGELAAAIVTDFELQNGLFTSHDLAGYAPELTPAWIGRYGRFDIATVPLPASGPQLTMMLGLAQDLDLASLFAKDDLQYFHRLARLMAVSFADRAQYFGDPETLSTSIDWLFSEPHRRHQAALVAREDPIKINKLSPAESPTTTHVSVVDDEGTAVSLTHTLGSASGVVVKGLGFIFNNCMYQFCPVPGKPNSVSPRKRRLSGIAPSVLSAENDVQLAIGGSGGTRIPTGILQTLLHLMDHNMSPVEAVTAPRIHTEDEFLEMEARLPSRLQEGLRGLQWVLRPSPYAFDRKFSLVVVAQRDADKGFRGSGDPRSGGAVAITGCPRALVAY